MESQKKMKINWTLILTCLACLAMGIAMLIYHNETGALLLYLVCGILVVFGIIRIIQYFVRHEETSVFSFTGIAYGLTFITIGVCTYFFRKAFSDFIPLLISFLLIFLGFACCHSSVFLAKSKAKLWYLQLLFGLFTVAGGVLSLSGNFRDTSVLFIILGIILCIDAILIAIVNILYVTAKNGEIRTAEAVAEATQKLSASFGQPPMAVPTEEPARPVETEPVREETPPASIAEETPSTEDPAEN